MKMRYISCAFNKLLLGVVLVYHVSANISMLQVQLHEQKISQHNDTEYVRQIMQRAKSAEMRAYMQPELDVCENFYLFSCGNWPKINPAGRISPPETNFFEQLTNAYNQKQLRVLQEGRQKGDSDIDGKVKSFYETCLRLSGLKNHSYKLKLAKIIAEFGQMPALCSNDSSWSADDFDWLQTIGKIQNRYGLDAILQLGIRKDFESKTVNKLFIGQPTLRLQTKSMYTSEATKWHRDTYKQEIQTNLQKYLDVDEGRAGQVANEILEFEVQLSNGIMNQKLGKTLKSSATLRTLDEIQTAYAPTLDLKKYITTALGHELNDTFYEYMLDYQTNLVAVIQNSTKTQLANYIYYQLIQVFFSDFEESANIREKLCLKKTKLFFAKILDNMIFRKYNNKGTERDINLIWQKLKETFRAELESDKLNWMSLMTRKLALEKLAAMKLEVNSYEKLNFSAEFAELNISNSDYIANVQQVLVFETKRAIASLYELPKPVDAAVMLSYSPAHIATENLIKIPVSLLQPNYLWSDHYPNALKFGTLGYLVAHELLHGFDDMGRNYDVTGNEKSWWDTNTTEAFNERKACFKRQYGRYRYGGKYLPESELQAENIADNGAVQVAFSAYMNWLSSVSANQSSATEMKAETEFGVGERQQILEMESLPNLNYTNKQLFFISFAQFWCSDVSEHFKAEVSLIDTHAPSMFRVIGSLANFDAFAQVFNCAKGSTMNPHQKCQIY